MVMHETRAERKKEKVKKMSAIFEIPGVFTGRALGLLLDIAVFVIVYYYLKSGKIPYVRRVAGLDAIEEAVGRSAEMGKPVMSTIGIDGFNYWTLAALTILDHVARDCAKKGCRILVPTGGSDSSYIVRPVAEEIVKNAYKLEGKEEDYRPEDLPFLSGQQYAYTGGVVGIIQRTKPGACIMVGGHHSEAMNIAETSNMAGALTITSGTYMGNVAVLACASDYILIGEETPAAGAYLSKDPAQRASIRCQDIYKGISIALIILGTIVLNFGSNFFIQLLSS